MLRRRLPWLIARFLIHPSVTFIAGETSKNYVVTIVDDVEVEESEYVAFAFGTLPADVVRSTDTGYSTHRLEITDNDTTLPPPPPASYVVSFDTASLVVDEGVGTVAVMVSITPTPFAVDGAITIPIVVDGLSTAIPADYTLPNPSSVTFKEGETRKNYVVTIVDNTLREESKLVAFTFGTLPSNVVAPALYRPM